MSNKLLFGNAFKCKLLSTWKPKPLQHVRGYLLLLYVTKVIKKEEDDNKELRTI